MDDDAQPCVVAAFAVFVGIVNQDTTGLGGLLGADELVGGGFGDVALEVAVLFPRAIPLRKKTGGNMLSSATNYQILQA